jgi:Zn-dependent peptidase ImmA (M78 family)
LFSNYEVRKLTARIEKFRKLIIELREDMQEPVDKFSPPKIEDNASPKTIAKEVISWLKEEKNLDFNQWKEKLEEKNIFVFLTSKYRGWSHIGKDLFRGLAIYHSCLPIIIINDSDIKKTQSLTLFHELGHLLRRESAIDDWDEHPKKVEKWCDELAGNILMPETLFSDDSYNAKDLRGIKKMAKEFNVSNYACLVRLRQLQIIDQTTYLKVEQELKKEYVRMQEKLKESQGGPARNRPQEVIDQYGHIYARALFQAYHNQEISLHKLSQAFDLKRASSVLEVYDKL